MNHIHANSHIWQKKTRLVTFTRFGPQLWPVRSPDLMSLDYIKNVSCQQKSQEKKQIFQRNCIMGEDENNRKAKFSLCYSLNCAHTKVEGIVNSSQGDIIDIWIFTLSNWNFFFNVCNIVTLANTINAVTQLNVCVLLLWCFVTRKFDVIYKVRKSI